MAGEWIPIDCNLGTKPEVLELVDVTGEPVEVVGWRLIQLWSWAAMNTADGVLRATPRRLAALAGGDERFWLAVEQVGWVTFRDGTVEIAGWEKRFSRAAKARMEDARRKCVKREENRNVRKFPDKCPENIGLQDNTRQDSTTQKDIPAAPVPTSKPAARSREKAAGVSWTPADGWQGITDDDRREWAAAFPGAVLEQELAKATAWLKANPQRCGKRNWRRFVVGWLQRCQDKGGTNRETVRPGASGPPPVPREKRRWWRGDAGRSMTDAEHAEWVQSQARVRAGPIDDGEPVSDLIARTMTKLQGGNP